jgi:hypothetical protein
VWTVSIISVTLQAVLVGLLVLRQLQRLPVGRD